MTFDHREEGTLEQDWQNCPDLRDLTRRLELPQRLHLIVLMAHPDDETLAAGGLIATAANHGASIDILIATDGEGSHPHSPTHPPTVLAARRRREAHTAARLLSPQSRLSLLQLPDGKVMEHLPTLRLALERALRYGRGDAGQSQWIVTTWRADNHPDHEACALAGAYVSRSRTSLTHLQAPIWAWHWADADRTAFPWPYCRKFAVSRTAWATKQRALQQYRSQRQPLSAEPGDEPIVTAAMAEHFQRPFEFFIDEQDRRTDEHHAS